MLGLGHYLACILIRYLYDSVADLTDADFFLTALSQTLFPGTSGLEVHNGFGDSQARYTLAASRVLRSGHNSYNRKRSALDVLAATQQALSTHGTNSVTIVGHSLGAAIALIDAIYLPLHLPSTTTFKFVGYSLPRVGNPAFADYLDSKSSHWYVNDLLRLSPLSSAFP